MKSNPENNGGESVKLGIMKTMATIGGGGSGIGGRNRRGSGGGRKW